MVAPQPRPSSFDDAPALTLPASILFPNGLVGCPDWQHFTLLALPDLPGLLLLRSNDEEGVAFVLAEVEALVPDYRQRLAPNDATTVATLGVGSDPAVQLYCTLTVQEDGTVTANLLGPLVIDFGRGLGFQLVLADSPWPVRYPLSSQTPEGEPCSS
ncbi:flagellar assembly protein FliW [Thermorudis peleae]|uniref:flagellar assembly protein FliW n=1 Tax=Thermorudis peleae TaxID=1382356 RepID=UPI0009E03104|nr:flagellar assembly protein FliW [Thermorudis peleae]